MRCCNCGKHIDEYSSYWENDDEEHFCSEVCLDIAEKNRRYAIAPSAEPPRNKGGSDE